MQFSQNELFSHSNNVFSLMHEHILMKISDIKDQSMYKKVRGGIFPKMKIFGGI